MGAPTRAAAPFLISGTDPELQAVFVPDGRERAAGDAGDGIVAP
jgi:hypothetical protein